MNVDNGNNFESDFYEEAPTTVSNTLDDGDAPKINEDKNEELVDKDEVEDYNDLMETDTKLKSEKMNVDNFYLILFISN